MTWDMIAHLTAAIAFLAIGFVMGEVLAILRRLDARIVQIERAVIFKVDLADFEKEKARGHTEVEEKPPHA